MDNVLMIDVVLQDADGREWQDVVAIYDGELSPSIDMQVCFQFNDLNEFLNCGKYLYDDIEIVEIDDWYIENNR